MAKVLIAEDNPGLARVMAFNLRNRGLEVEVAHRGDDAWKAIQAKPFDLLVSDYEMPGMNGLELVKEIRESKEHTHIPVILITGRQMELDTCKLSESLRLEVILPKPFSPSQMVSIAEEVLAKANLACEK